MTSVSAHTGSKERVAILSAFSTPFRSGAEACAEEVALCLCDRYAITIVTAHLQRALPRTAILQQKHTNGSTSLVHIQRIGLGCSIDKWLFPVLAPFTVRHLRPHIVHAVLESYAGLAMVFCALLVPSVKRILTCQSTNTRSLLWIMHQAADAVTCISSVLVKRARTLGRPDVYLIPNGINVRLMEDAASQKKVPGRILFVGRLERMKGVETLLDAFAILAPKHQQLQLRVVGGGSLRYALEQRCSKLLERGRIAFLGQCSLEDTRKEYAEAEYFCALSRSEALGNVFLEAQVAGCAVVATNVGGIPDIVIHGKTGLLVPPDDPVSAAQALERLMQDSALQNRLCENGKLHAAQYDWSRIAEEYGSLYGKILRPSSPMS